MAFLSPVAKSFTVLNAHRQMIVQTIRNYADLQIIDDPSLRILQQDAPNIRSSKRLVFTDHVIFSVFDHLRKGYAPKNPLTLNEPPDELFELHQRVLTASYIDRETKEWCDLASAFFVAANSFDAFSSTAVNTLPLYRSRLNTMRMLGEFDFWRPTSKALQKVDLCPVVFSNIPAVAISRNKAKPEIEALETALICYSQFTAPPKDRTKWESWRVSGRQHASHNFFVRIYATTKDLTPRWSRFGPRAKMLTHEDSNQFEEFALTANRIPRYIDERNELGKINLYVDMEIE